MIELVTVSSNEDPTSYVDSQILGKDKYICGYVQHLLKLDKPDSEENLVVKNEMKKKETSDKEINIVVKLLHSVLVKNHSGSKLCQCEVGREK